MNLVKASVPNDKIGFILQMGTTFTYFWLVGLNAQTHKVHAVMEFGLLYLYSEEGSKG